MRVAGMNWMQMEARVRADDRCVLPIGSVEQHAYLSLATDMILAERVALEAAGPLDVPVFPVLPYGLASGFTAFPGTVSLRLSTYLSVVSDILDSLYRTGFRRILIVNGHGGNTPVTAQISEWLNGHEGARVRFHDWWRAPKTWAKVMEIDPAASHASWMENFPWTRLEGVTLPEEAKPRIDFDRLAQGGAADKRALLGDGNYHGLYQRPDVDMEALWAVAVEETRALLTDGWL